MRARRLRAIATAVIAGGVLGLSANASPASAAIRVLTTDGEQLASFASMQCRTDRAGFHANGTARGWKLAIRINPFAGFKRLYEVEYDDQSRAFFILDPPGGGRTFSNGVVPKTDIPRLTLGGSVAFPRGRATVGLQFGLAYDSTGSKPNIVRLTGTARCTYGRR